MDAQGRRTLAVLLVVLCFACLGCKQGCGTGYRGETELIRYSHSDTCGGVLTYDPAQVEIVVEGLEITVIHRNAILNCCLDSIVVELTREHNLLRIQETEVAPNPCDCVCPFEVRATIGVSSPGIYVIEIWTHDVMVWKGEVLVEGG